MGLDDNPPKTEHRRVGVAHLFVGAVAAAVVAFATRNDPLLSPDSITYLSAAERLRSGDGLVDFTGEPLAHFPPLFPLVLAAGGQSLVWASIIGALVAAGVAVLLFDVLASRVRSSVALAAALVYALSQAALYHETTVWSETPYLLFALGTIRVLGRQPLTVPQCAIAGCLAGLGFLTRYVGAGLVLTGLVVVLATSAGGDRRPARRLALAYLTPSAILATGWMTRNLLATGDPLGPHFEGGSGSSAVTLIRQVTLGAGQLVSDIDGTGALTRAFGYVALGGLVACAAFALARPPRNPTDIAMAVFAGMSILVPVASSVVAGTDLSARLLSPSLVPIVYFAAIAVERRIGDRVVVTVAAAIAAVTLAVGLEVAIDTPDRLDGSSDNAELHSPELHGLVSALPADASVLTNNPHRVWWHSDRFPVRLAFTEPTPGNSHFPLSPEETLQLACAGETYLAWFSTLRNAQGMTPDELRPDLTERVSLTPIESVRGGTLFAVGVVDTATCA